MLFRSIYFCFNYLLSFLATFVATLTFDQLGGLDGGFAVLLVLPLVASGMIEGQQFVRRYGYKPTVRQCWLASLRMTSMVVLIVLSVFVPMLVASPDSVAILAEVNATGRAAVYLLLCFLTCCILRIGYGIGLATEMKAQQFSDK